MITRQVVLTLNPRHPSPDVAAQKLDTAAKRFGIASKRQQAMFMAQLTHESGLIPQEENLRYSAKRICQVWPSRFPTIEAAAPCAYNPQALGDRVYSGRMGNGPGEGHLYRGRGLVQLTGKGNYQTYGAMTGFDLVKDPDLLLQYGVGSLVAGAFWYNLGLNALAEAGNVREVTRRINGGFNGLDDRERLYQRAVRVVPMGLMAVDAAPDLTTDLDADHALFQGTFEQALAALGG